MKRIVSFIITSAVAMGWPLYAVASTPVLTTEQATEIALQQTGGGQIFKSELDTDDETSIYEFGIKNDIYRFEIDVDAVDGEILKYEKKIPIQERNFTNNMTFDEAASIALQRVSGDKNSISIYKNSFRRNGGQASYVVKLWGDGFEYEVKINANTKEVYEYEKDGTKIYDAAQVTAPENTQQAAPSAATQQQPTTPPAAATPQQPTTPSAATTPQPTTPPAAQNKTRLTSQQAIDIAFSRSGGGMLQKIELDHDDGALLYEIDIKNGVYEHEFKIDAYTGAVLKYEIDD